MRAHGAQVCRKLAAVMHAVVLRHRKECHRGRLHEPEEINFLRQLVAWRRAQLIDLVAHGLFIERDGVSRTRQLPLGFFGRSLIELELAVEYRLNEPAIRGGDVPGELNRRSRFRVGFLVAVAATNGSQNLGRRRNLALDHHCVVFGKKLGLISVHDSPPDGSERTRPTVSICGT